jgi:hypothetical protein
MPVVPESILLGLCSSEYTIGRTAGFGGVHLPEGRAVMCISVDESSPLEGDVGGGQGLTWGQDAR